MLLLNTEPKNHNEWRGITRLMRTQYEGENRLTHI